MEVNIMLGWDCHAIPSCRTKMPIPQDRDDAIIHTMSKPLEEPFFHDRTLASMVIFHNYVTLKAVGQL